MEYCKEEGQRDLKTQRALEKGRFLHDDNLLALKPKMKPIVTAPPPLVLQTVHSPSNN